jgi:hypothetical protein
MPVRMTINVATPRGRPHRCSRSTIGLAAADSSSPMMTGTRTTESSVKTLRNT